MIDLTPGTDRLAEIVRSVDQTDLDRPTPCREYCVGDLLDHIRGFTVAFGAAARKAGGEPAEMGPAGDAASLDPDWKDSIPRQLEGLARAWREPEAWTGTTRVGGGDLPGDVAGIIAAGEVVVHGWDLARALDRPFDADQDAVGPLYELASKTFGPGNDAARGDAFGPAVPVAPGAPLLDRTLGLLGRDPSWIPR